MEIAFDEIATNDLKFWKSAGNKKIQKRIEKLITAIVQSPYKVIGKPEGL